MFLASFTVVFQGWDLGWFVGLYAPSSLVPACRHCSCEQAEGSYFCLLQCPEEAGALLGREQTSVQLRFAEPSQCWCYLTLFYVSVIFCAKWDSSQRRDSIN